MDVRLTYSPLVEAQALLATLDFVSVGLFKSLNMHVLPFEAANREHPYGVIIPKLPYYNWKQVLQNLSQPQTSSANATFLQYYPPELNLVVEEITKVYGNQTQAKVTKEQLVPVLEDIESDLGIIFGKKVFSELDIYITRFGFGTKNTSLNKLPAKLELCIREGASTTNVIASIVDALTHLKKNELKLESSELRPIRDWLITNSRIRQTLAKHNLKYVPSTTYFRKKTTDKFNKHSEAYVASLGIFKENLCFTCNEKGISFNGKVLVGLTPNEHKVLALLIGHKNTAISHDAVLDLLEGDGKVLNYYAAYKVIERLRTKLTVLGIPANLIKSVPKQGVMLVSQ